MIFAVRQCRWVVCVAMALIVALTSTVLVQAVGIHPSGRYYTDAAGNPMFLIGYYGWAAVPDSDSSATINYYIDSPARYSQMITQGGPYQINYIRISLGVNRMTASTNPPSWNGVPTPVPFVYNGSNKALLPDSISSPNWDSTFWTGLKNQCTLAKDNGNGRRLVR